MKTVLAGLIVCMLFPAILLADEVKREETISVTVSDGDPVEIYNINGDIVFEEWDSSELRLVYTVTSSDAEALDYINVEIDTDQGLVCDVQYDDDWDDFDDSSVDFAVSIPSNTELDIESAFVNGDMYLIGGKGAAKLELVNGNIEIDDFNGSLVANLVNGEMDVSGTPGITEINLVNGAINCTISELSGNAELSSVSGDVILELLTEARVSIGTISGDIDIDDAFGATVNEDYVGRTSEFGEGEYSIDIGTVSGDIYIVE